MNRFEQYLALMKRMNWLMTLAIGALLSMGVCFIYSACYSSESSHIRLLYTRQITWMLAGLGCYAWFAFYDYRKMGRFSWWVYGATIFLLVFVLFSNPINNARSWLSLFGLKIQPSELSKIVTIILLARLMSQPGIKLWELRTVFLILGIVLVPITLVVLQPDPGTALIFLPVTFILMFVAGVPLRFLMTMAGIAILAVTVILSALFLPAKLGWSEERQEKIVSLTLLKKHQRERIMTFFYPDKDPLKSGWNKIQSERAVGSGGMWGKGFKQGTQNILGFLPRAVAHTDFIYSVIAEEKGFAGSVSVLLLFGIIIVVGMQTAVMARDRMGRLLCVAVVSMIFSHVFINIAMTVGLMPIIGVPLPLLSYGGSFMIVTMSSLGIVQSVYIRCRPAESPI